MHFSSKVKLFLALGWSFIAGLVPAMSQGLPDSLLKLQQGIGILNWQTSGNAVWLPDAAIPAYARAGIKYDNTSGNFRRPQQFKAARSTGFQGDGLGQYRNWLFQGSFSYQKFSRDSLRFANVARPYEGNPFITADSAGGNWGGDQLTATLQVATPAFGKWRGGINLAYETEQAARDNDPKPLYRYLNFHVQPSVAFEIPPKSKLSLSAAYFRKSEEVETGFFSTNNPPLYSLRGYGTFTKGPVVTAERTSAGNGWQAGAEYLFRTAHTNFLVGARLGGRREDDQDGVSLPVFIGGLDETSGQAFMTLEHRLDRAGWLASAEAWFKDGTGFDPVFQAVNPAYYWSGLKTRLGWWKQPGGAGWFNVNLYPGITYTNYYESIAKTDWTSVMLHADADVVLAFHFSDRLLLTVRPLIGYHPNLQGDLLINRPTTISTLLVRPDYQFSTQSYLRGMLSAAASYRISETYYKLEISYDRLSTTSGGASIYAISSRNLFQTSLHLLF